MKPSLLILFAAGFSVGDQAENEFTILHTNDVHSHYDQINKFGTDCTKEQQVAGKCFGGLARLKTKIDEMRAANKNTLLLDAGDQFQGTLFYTYFRGNVTWEAMNLLQYNASTLGNHEFDDGPANTGRVVTNYNFPLVSSNVDASAYPELSRVIKKHHIFKEHGLGIVGYLTYDAPTISNIGNVIVEDPVVAVQREINILHKRKITRIIAVSHNGYLQDIELAKKVTGLSLIVGGHSHSYLSSKTYYPKIESEGNYPTAVKHADGNITYIVQAYQWTRFLGHIDISFNKHGFISKISGEPIPLEFSVKQNAAAVEFVKKMRQSFDKKGKEVIGLSTIDLDQDKCKFQECRMGSLIADAVLDSRPDADFSLINGGGVRAAIKKGNITTADILAVFPFGDLVVDLKLTGTQIWDLLEGVVSKKNRHDEEVGFIQVSGLRFTYSGIEPIGKKVGQVVVFDPKTKAYHPISPGRIYTIASFSFVANGGDRILNPSMENLVLLDTAEEVVMKYIKKQSPIRLPLERRINRVDDINLPPQLDRHHERRSRLLRRTQGQK